MFVRTNGGDLLNVQQISRVYVEEGRANELIGLETGTDVTDKHYATAYALSGDTSYELFDGRETKTYMYFDRLVAALKEGKMLLDFKTEDLYEEVPIVRELSVRPPDKD